MSDSSFAVLTQRYTIRDGAIGLRVDSKTEDNAQPFNTSLERLKLDFKFGVRINYEE